jgi:tRNA(fMet)-specific endonuclease VapC
MNPSCLDDGASHERQRGRSSNAPEQKASVFSASVNSALKVGSCTRFATFMDYLLDTNACIALINGSPPEVRAHFQQANDAGSRILVSSIAVFELWYGVAKSSRQDFNRKRVEAFLAGPILSLPFEDEDSRVAGTVRANLESVGKPIGAYDLLMAGQALRHRLTLVTANGREFSRLKGLDWQDWAR